MTNLITDNKADLVLGVEGHLKGNAAYDIATYAGQVGCYATSAPSSSMMARVLGEETEGGQTDPAAGIVAVMSRQMHASLRRTEKSVSGRLLHLIFGDGANPKDDKSPVHVIAAYGLSGQNKKSGARAQLARALAQGLEDILDNSIYHGHKFIIYADINAVALKSDRANGKLHNYDSAQGALWKTLMNEKYELVDLMKLKYENEPPKTYAPKGKPVSRIDVIFTSKSIADRAQAATGAELGELSATHLPLACSFDAEMDIPDQDRSVEATRDAAVVIMATMGGRKWSLSAKAEAIYLRGSFTSLDVQKRFREADETFARRTADAAEIEDESLQAAQKAIVEAAYLDSITTALLYAEHFAVRTAAGTARLRKKTKDKRKREANKNKDIADRAKAFAREAKTLLLKSLETQEESEGMVEVILDQLYAKLNEKGERLKKDADKKAGYPVGPGEKVETKESSWIKWLEDVAVHAEAELALEGWYDGYTGCHTKYERTREEKGVHQERTEETVTKIVGGKRNDWSGKMELLVGKDELGEPVLHVGAKELAAKVRETLQESGFKLHWMTKIFKQTIFT